MDALSTAAGEVPLCHQLSEKAGVDSGSLGFEVAAGSVTGSRHRFAGKNNQDALAVRCDRATGITIAVVCDGCSSGSHSEVGAKLGAQVAVTAIAQLLHQCPGDAPWQERPFWRAVEEQVLAQLQTLAAAMGGIAPSLVEDYFLFTLVGALLTEREIVAFSIGDGALIVNGQSWPLGPFPNNAPPYLAYRLLNPALAEATALQFQVHGPWPSAQVETMLIGTDGVLDLAQLETRSQPGKTEPVGPLSQFWQDDRYFLNPDAVRRKLAQINREVTQPDWQGQRLVRQSGLLPDDTTLVVLRLRQ